MLENRSFDHLLGYLEHPDPRFNGLLGRELYNVSLAGTRVPATSDGRPQLADPDHSHEGVLMQLGPYGDVPSNGGFVRSYELAKGTKAGPQVMRCLDAKHGRGTTFSRSSSRVALITSSPKWLNRLVGEHRSQIGVAILPAPPNASGRQRELTVIESVVRRTP